MSLTNSQCPSPAFLQAFWRAAVMLVLSGWMLNTGRATADEPPVSRAPPGMSILKPTTGGVWFIASDLKKRYDGLVDEVRNLQSELLNQGLSTQEARERIGALRDDLEQLRLEIERKKLLISPYKVHTQTETTLFDFGPQKLLVINADRVTVEGWDGPQIKCVLEKSVLASGETAVDDELKGIQLVHRHGPNTEIVGRTAEEQAREEAKYLASPDGQKLNAAQRAQRARLVAEISDSRRPYRAFQGREFDLLEVSGLAPQQGNRYVSVRVDSEGGDGHFGSDLVRHATLTVYVPPCTAVALRGCRGQVDVSSLRGALILTSDGSQTIDYNGRFSIRDLHGDLTADNVPLDEIDTVVGHVTISSTTEQANTGTRHADNLRTSYTPAARVLTCENIKGDLTAWFGRVDLKLAGVGGQIDVRNEFGDTTLTLTQPLAPRAHRLVSESGRVEISLPAELLAGVPLSAFTNCGTARTNIGQDQFSDMTLTTSSVGDRSRRNWRGFLTKGEPDPLRFLKVIERLDATLSGADRSPGLDAISRAGTVSIKRIE
ncbi:MAG: hypothetical protein JSS02_22015 [Planctomycetes bacterium]|nr:hypothetical protein [Planctomycetota bacterium]